MAIWISGLISGQYCYYFYYYFIIISLFFCYYFNYFIFIVIFYYYFYYIGLISNNIVNTQRDSLFMGHCTSDQLLEY